MGILIYTTPRIFVRRSAQQRLQGLSLFKIRHKASSTGNISYSRLLKEEEKPTSTALKTSAPWLGWKSFAPRTVIKSYARAQEKRPYTTQVCSAVIIWCGGDLLAQWIGEEDYDGWRTLRNITIGCIIAIPGYKWFMYLGQSFNYSSKFKSLAAKVAVNQILFSPIFNTYFFGMQSLLSGDRIQDAIERIKNTVPTSVVNAWMIWPAVTAFNFTYIAPQSRALFAGVVAMGWQSYLSWLNQRAANKERAQKLLAMAEPHESCDRTANSSSS